MVRLFEGEAWRRLRLVVVRLDVRLGEGGLVEVEMPLEKVRGPRAGSRCPRAA